MVRRLISSLIFLAFPDQVKGKILYFRPQEASMDNIWNLHEWRPFYHFCNNGDLLHHILEKCEKIPTSSAGQNPKNYTGTSKALSVLSCEMNCSFICP